METIQVDYQMIYDYEKKMRQQQENIDMYVSKIYTHVDTISQVWQGKDSLAFKEAIDAFEGDSVKLSRLLERYCDFLNRSAQAYEQIQNEISTRAMRLVR